MSAARQPRGAVKVNGSAVTGWKGWTWDGNTMFLADQFSVTFALGGLPSGRGVDWWAAQTSLEVELFAGFPADPSSVTPADLQSLFIGNVDEFEVVWESGLLRLSGRDLTAAFLDNKTSEKFPEQTASQIATLLAGRRGLTPVVTATTAKVGRYYKDGHVRLADDRTEWDLLTWLAREEGFVVYVLGRELHFEPAQTGGTYALAYKPGGRGALPTGDMVRTSTARVLTIARDIVVIGRSWSLKTKKLIVRKAVRSRKGSGLTQTYVVNYPGVDADTLQKKVNAKLAEISKHEMRLRFDGPADNVLKKSDLIAFSGTGTAFDQTYYPDSIARTMDADGGYTWSVAAKNHATESEANL